MKQISRSSALQNDERETGVLQTNQAGENVLDLTSSAKHGIPLAACKVCLKNALLVYEASTWWSRRSRPVATSREGQIAKARNETLVRIKTSGRSHGWRHGTLCRVKDVATTPWPLLPSSTPSPTHTHSSCMHLAALSSMTIYPFHFFLSLVNRLRSFSNISTDERAWLYRVYTPRLLREGAQTAAAAAKVRIASL